VFPNAACTTAFIDRVVQPTEIIAIEGESYRRREAQHGRAAKPSRRPEPKD
jgi:DNA replication protein DnaC